MIAIERYCTLYDKLRDSGGRLRQPVEVSLEQLADTWYCTVRNVKLIIRKLEEEHWVEWRAGRGRGHLSRITLLIEKDSLLLEQAQSLASQGEYKSAFALMDDYLDDVQVKSMFMSWLNGHFGHRKETRHGMNDADVLRCPVYFPLTTLDTAELVYAFDSHMVRQLFNTLVQFDHVRNCIVSSIAHTWEHDEEGKVWTFYLRKGIMFHHGVELNADDVIFTLNRLQADRTQSWMVRTIDSIEKLSHYAIRLYLTMPNWLLPRLLCSTTMSIIPMDWGGVQEAEYWELPSGTGPFRIMEWNDNQCILQAHTAYFQGRPHLDEVRIVFLPSDSAAYADQTNWSGLMYGMDYSKTMTDAEWKRVEWLSRGCNLIHWNMNKDGPHQSYVFRRALNVLLDRQRMIQELEEDRVYPARSFYPKETTPLERDLFDPGYGMKLLKESGYDGSKIVIMTYAKHEKDLYWLQSHYSQYGIVIEVQIEDWRTVRKPERYQHADGMLNGFILAEEEVCLLELFEQKGSYIKEWMTPDMNNWIHDMLNHVLCCQQPEHRWLRFADIERRIVEDGSVMPLLHKKFNTKYHQRVRGIGTNTLGWIDFKDIWVAPQEAELTQKSNLT